MRSSVVTVISVSLLLTGCAGSASTLSNHIWMIGMIGCVIAVPYEYITHQYGFLAVCFVNFVIAWRAYRRWSMDEMAEG